jgi:hypothetical protein
MDKEKRNQYIKGNQAGKAACTMEALLGEEGVKLYKAALKEECNDPEIFETLLGKAQDGLFKDSPGQEDKSLKEKLASKTPFWAQMLGPAGVGKTSAAAAVLPFIAEFLPEAEVTFEKRTVKVDGGDTRDNSKVRREVLELAINKGYTGIKNLYDIGDKPILGPVKKDVFDWAKNEGANIIVPTTTFKKEFIPQEGTQEVIIAVMGSSELVKYQQEGRAWKTQWPIDTNDPNHPSKSEKLPESKSPPFWQILSYARGVKQAKDAVAARKAEGALVFFAINDCILVKKEGNKWVPTTDVKKATKQVSERIYNEYCEAFEKNENKSDFTDNYQFKLLPPIITTPELLKVENDIKKLKELKELKDNPDTNQFKSILEEAEKLHSLWSEKKWDDYANSVVEIGIKIKDKIIIESIDPETKQKLMELQTHIKEAKENIPEYVKSSGAEVNLAPARVPAPIVSSEIRQAISSKGEAFKSLVRFNQLLYKYAEEGTTPPKTKKFLNELIKSIQSSELNNSKDIYKKIEERLTSKTNVAENMGNVILEKIIWTAKANDFQRELQAMQEESDVDSQNSLGLNNTPNI